MRIVNGYKLSMFVRIGDQEPKDWDTFTEKEKKEIGQKLNEQAARSVALRVNQTA